MQHTLCIPHHPVPLLPHAALALLWQGIPEQTLWLQQHPVLATWANAPVPTLSLCTGSMCPAVPVPVHRAACLRHLLDHCVQLRLMPKARHADNDLRHVMVVLMHAIVA